MKASVELIGEHTSTGASDKVHTLGSDSRAGGAAKQIATATRLIAISGINGHVLKIEGSLDGTNYFSWITTVSSDSLYIVDDGPLYMRSNCTTGGSGVASVYMQKFVAD